MPDPASITIVSGLPRSGTSVMMQMLVAGGIPPLTDDIRKPDADNPRGYFEFERAKQIKADKAWLADAEGKVVKMVHLLLPDLPPDGDRRYDIVFMRRDLAEVVRSQGVMLARVGKPGGNIAAEPLIAVYRQQIDRVLKHLAGRSGVRLIEINYNDLVRSPGPTAEKVAEFLHPSGRTMDVGAMARAVDPALYRNRS
jgi:hypothetical protein